MFKSLSTAGGVTRRVAFIDGSGQTAVCNCVVLAGIVYEGPASYVYAFSDYVDALRRRYGIAGELKWRELWRRAAPPRPRSSRNCSKRPGSLCTTADRRARPRPSGPS